MKMSKKIIAGLIMTIMACSSLLSHAARNEEVTLLMVPRDEAVVKLGTDISNKYPTLLISYVVGKNGALSLHGFTAGQWVNITEENFKSGNFFRTGPSSTVIVEKEGEPVPYKLVPPVDWCKNVSKITTTEMRPLLHLIGQYYDFNYKQWKWFASQYGFSIEAINPEDLNISWYQKRMDAHFKSDAELGKDDLQYWKSIRKVVYRKKMVAEPVVADPVVAAEEEPEPVVEPEAEPVQEEIPAEEVEAEKDPFEEEAPAAMVLGAGEAEEVVEVVEGEDIEEVAPEASEVPKAEEKKATDQAVEEVVEEIPATEQGAAETDVIAPIAVDAATAEG